MLQLYAIVCFNQTFVAIFQMSCVVPGCKSGYGTDNVYPPGVGKHRFPKNPLKRKRWANAIPRSEWEPTDHSRICSLHFDSSDYETVHKDTNKHRKTDPELKNRRLKSTAVPRYFPGCPTYLSREPLQERSEAATSNFRQKKAADQIEKQSNEFLQADNVNSYDDLLSKLPAVFPSSWNAFTLKKEDQLIIEDVEFCEDGKPRLKFSLTITSKLLFSLYSNDTAVPSSKVQHITEQNCVKRHSDVSNLLAFLNAYSAQGRDSTDVIQECIANLSKIAKESVENDDILRPKLQFIIEQLILSILPVHQRKYSPSFIWNCLAWMKNGPGLYRQLLAEGLMTLPSVSRLQRLGSSYHLETGKTIFQNFLNLQ